MAIEDVRIAPRKAKHDLRVPSRRLLHGQRKAVIAEVLERPQQKGHGLAAALQGRLRRLGAEAQHSGTGGVEPAVADDEAIARDRQRNDAADPAASRQAFHLDHGEQSGEVESLESQLHVLARSGGIEDEPGNRDLAAGEAGARAFDHQARRVSRRDVVIQHHIVQRYRRVDALQRQLLPGRGRGRQKTVEESAGVEPLDRDPIGGEREIDQFHHAGTADGLGRPGEARSGLGLARHRAQGFEGGGQIARLQPILGEGEIGKEQPCVAPAIEKSVAGVDDQGALAVGDRALGLDHQRAFGQRDPAL